MATTTKAPATAAGPTSHTHYPATTRPTDAAQRLLQLLADHDHGQGVQLLPLGRGGRYRHHATGKTHTRATFIALAALKYITWDTQTYGLVHVTDAGRSSAEGGAK